MAIQSLICKPSGLLNLGATWSLTSGTADSAHPLTNLNSPYAHLLSKTTGTSATYRGTIASTALKGVAFINCGAGLAGLTVAVTNNGAMPSQNLVIPSVYPDGVQLNAFLDLRAVTTAGTQWNFAITGASANISVGKILLIRDLDEIQVLWSVGVKERKPTIIHRTDYDVALGYRKAVRFRQWRVQIGRESQRAAWTTLRRGSEGPTQPFLWVPDYTVNDPAYAWFPEPEWEHLRHTPLHTPFTDQIEECNPGAPH